MKNWLNNLQNGEPWVWFSAAALVTCVAAVSAVVCLVAFRGLTHFWPADVAEITLVGGERVIGEIVEVDDLSRASFIENGGSEEILQAGQQSVTRWLLKTGNRRIDPPDFRWVFAHEMALIEYPEDIVVIEREAWGNAYGHIVAIELNTSDPEPTVVKGTSIDSVLLSALVRLDDTRGAIRELEQGSLNRISSELEALRLELRRQELSHDGPELTAVANIAAQERVLLTAYREQEQILSGLLSSLTGTALVINTHSKQWHQDMSEVLRVQWPNRMSFPGKFRAWLGNVWRFLSDNPREANTEGGVFPAIFGTVLMVLLMSVFVAPIGIITAIYLHEYAQQGPLVRTLRIAVGNLAGVPSIVYGVFGLGFFVYVLGGNLDTLFFPEALPAPTFGTPGLIWASLTLALLTLPVVIVSTEEGLTRIPQSLREGSLALGATRAETLFRVVLPMATPAMLTGIILAVARAAGEVAPLMLVGVVKLAPQLPIDGEFPFLHLDRKFMHLGFHIYDVGFQSANIEAARPLVYATALLLITIVIGLNLSAIALRNRLERSYNTFE